MIGWLHNLTDDRRKATIAQAAQESGMRATESWETDRKRPVRNSNLNYCYEVHRNFFLFYSL
jgi:hypothetical protein